MTLASETVRGLLAAKITSLTYAVKEFRDENDAITEADLPCVLLQQSGPVEVDYLDGVATGLAIHSGPYLMTFAATTRETALAMLTATVNALAVDYNLGGQVLEITPLSYGDEEPDGRDIRAVMLEIRIRFETPSTDFGTLLT